MLKRAIIAYSQFDQFLQEATYREQESDSTLDGDSFYGLYTSWCSVSHNTPRTEHTFWAAMRHRVGSGHGLRMKGPAAANYILTSNPALV
ncbi:hypothetical protein [Pseudarthrobacter sp. NS4]|uniref:hypothetical protein n=1 Tax=Pseudarthrobacter sp. NS4 TaxID=2973976 RepID=UPI0028680FC2|nr:hypothetical protein [Pseudarthrobacter sp. NS4]